MGNTDQERTLAVKACDACEAGLLESDIFCRWCGAHQRQGRSELEHTGGGLLEASNPAASRYTTSGLRQIGRGERLYHSVSGPLVEAVVATVSASPSAQLSNRGIRNAVMALLSVPLWMIILLLSPFDAYAAARAISKEI